MAAKKNRKRSAGSWKVSFCGKNKYLDKVLSDSHFRSLVTAALGGGWNLVYALYHIVLAVWFRSFWFLAMGCYYLAACAMRASALHLSAKTADRQAAVRRNTVLTFVMAVIFIAVIYLAIAEKHNSDYNIIVAISMAVYTFYCITASVRNVVSLKKKRNMQMILLRNFYMVYAMGSMFGLERMMLGTFGDPDDRFTLVMEAASGAVFLMIIVIFGINLLLVSSKAAAVRDDR